ncbi:F-box only protein 28 [Scaptodrosophila lebanonensis]|uniref:F-box only protein 28 n=1 Tax=Drosophila lebanonensis TaxID=7225 RepID=A0A6J2UFM3_DROLE|nr:F-box only protein 28 [Scaptodrosophila lebanonensis]
MLNLLDLPDNVLMDIFELLSYDEVAKKREVCSHFNYIGQRVLNAGFNKIIQEHAKHFKRIKSMLPRRESERRNHCLARHSDILTSIETRISMLTMTYSKFIDLDICCFIPGRVLDEISNILKLLATTSRQLRPHEVLQELRDISSMAIEHFDEKIAVNFKMEHRSKLSESSGTRVVVCGALADISFSGVKRRTSVASSNTATKEMPLCGNVLCMSQKAAAFVQQARLLANAQPNANPTANANQPPKQDYLFKHIKKQCQRQKSIMLKVRSLESARSLQDRRLQEALSTITELSSQVSELKRQVEDVMGSKRGQLSVTATGNSGATKRQINSTDCLPSGKKPKV